MASAVALSALLVGCGTSDSGGEEAAPIGADSSKAAQPTESASPKASPSPSERPLSRFEDDPAVQALRDFAAAIGKSVNDGDPKLTAANPWMTKAGRARFRKIVDTKNAYYPGPLPFTPVRVTGTSDRRQVIRACFQTDGWAQNRKTRIPLEKVTYESADFVVVKQRGRLRFKEAYEANIDCSEVKVVGIPW